MQIANAILKVDKEGWTSVPKEGLTASEIAVLRIVHGPDAVFDIEPAGEIERSHREERARLKAAYVPGEGVRAGGGTTDPVETLFPGAAARMFMTLDELELPDDLYKAVDRLRPDAAPSPKAAKAGKAGAKQRPVPSATVDEDEDGVEDMSSNSADEMAFN